MIRVLVATDFSPAAENALKKAAQIASAGKWGVSLLHIKASNSAKLLEKNGKTIDQLDEYLKEIAAETTKKWGVDCNTVCRDGSIFSEINAEATKPEYNLLLIGTHGTKGLRQSLFGADLLKIARKSSVPLLATPDNAIVKEGGVKRILFPFGGHEHFDNKVKASAMLAKLCGAEIGIYSIQRFSNEVSSTTRDNVRKAALYFEEMGISVENIQDDMEEFSIGFAHRTLEYAKENKYDVISVMSIASDEYSFLSNVDKENLINNTFGISILLTSNY